MSDRDDYGWRNLTDFLELHDDQEATPTEQGEDPTLPSNFPDANTLISFLPQESSRANIQVSSTFYRGADLDSSPADIAILSSDGVLFAVHYERILEASSNNFAGLIVPTNSGASSPSIVQVMPLLAKEHSDLLNVVLHSLYGLSCDAYHPSFDCIRASFPLFVTYGLTPLAKYVCRGTPLFNTLLLHAPLHPIQAYILAASLRLEDFAVAASSYTLALELQQSISLEDADQIGDEYLFRLYKLHAGRMDSLREILRTKLYPHIATPRCTVQKRREASFAYELACAQIWHDASPAMSRTIIEQIMRRLYRTIDCSDCMNSVEKLLDDICTRWLLLERTI